MDIGITSHSDGFRLSQQRYALDLLARSGLTDTRTASTSKELHLQLRDFDGTLLLDLSRYYHLVDSLVYLAVTRPDIAHDVHTQLVCGISYIGSLCSFVGLMLST